MTATKRKYLVRRVVACAVVMALLGVGLARAFGGSSGSSAPPDRAAAFVPQDALVYLNLGTSRGSANWKDTVAAIQKLPLLGQLRDALFGATTGSTLGRLRLERDVEPWLGNEAAYASLPGESQGLLVLRVRDQQAALRAIGSAGGESYRGIRLGDLGSGSVAGLTQGWALIGPRAAVRKAIDARSSATGSLASDPNYNHLTGRLPDQRVLNGWLSGAWLQSHLATPVKLLAGAARAPGIQSAAFSFGDDGKRLRVGFSGLAAPGAPAGGGCTGESGTSDALFSKAPARPALFLGLGGAECILREMMASPGSAIGRALDSFAARAQKAGVNVDREVLPLLGGDSALSVTPGPTITLDAGEVPAEEGMNVLGRLQPALIDLLQPERGGTTPGFAAKRVNGVTALTAELTPGLQLSYAATGGDLLVSTALSGIGEAGRGRHLDQSKDFQLVLGDRPKTPSAVLFLDLQKFLALADEAGLGSNPTFSAVRDDLAKIGAAGAVLAREGNDIDAELRLKNP